MAQEGTQAIQRAAAILRRIARVSDGSPPTLAEIARSLDLSRSTAHRILKCLTEVGLADYDSQSRRYGIGLLCYELGLNVSDRVLDMVPLQAAVDRIAARTGLTSYLMRRSGFDAVCIHRAEGSTLIRVIPVEVGQRRFLGVGAGALALLAELDDETVERILAAIGTEAARGSTVSAEDLREAVARTRAEGYAVSDRKVTAATYGIGVAVPSDHGRTDFAISVAAFAPETDDEKARQWRDILFEEIARAARRA